MVSTLAPSALSASIVQDFTAMPFTCTTQQPHCEVSQPTWVPVRRRFSRRYCTSKVRGSTSALTDLPFTVIDTVGIRIILESTAERACFRAERWGRRLNDAKYRRFSPIWGLGTRTAF